MIRVYGNGGLISLNKEGIEKLFSRLSRVCKTKDTPFFITHAQNERNKPYTGPDSRHNFHLPFEKPR